jgi:hypothetical protein
MSQEPEEQPPRQEPRDDPSLPEEKASRPAEVGARFRRLIKGGPAQEPAEPPLPDRHPTGSPGLTGGWMAEDAPKASHETQARPPPRRFGCR